MPRFRLSHQVRDIHISIRTRHKINVVRIDQLLPHTLCHAADDANQRLLLLLAPKGLYLFQTMRHTLLGIVTYRTCVQQDDIRLVCTFRQRRARRLHHCRNDLTVCHIHLTAVSLYVKSLSHCLFVTL